MNTWYYYDSEGNRRGPINDDLFKQMARLGQIRPETQMETSAGRKAWRGRYRVYFQVKAFLLKTANPEVYRSRQSRQENRTVFAQTAVNRSDRMPLPVWPAVRLRPDIENSVGAAVFP